MKTTLPSKIGQLAGVLFASLLLNCQTGVLVDVHVTGRPDDVTSMVATAELNSVPAVGSGQSLTQTKDHFRVEFQEALTGQLKLHLSAQNAGGCELAEGEGSVVLQGAGTYPLEIALRPQQGCTLQVELVGLVPGSVTSIPPGIDCGSQCTYSYSRNQVVGLMQQTADLFGGWFADDPTAGSCAGRLSCAITIGSGVTRVRANFIHKTSCTASGWCVEEGLPPAGSLNNLYGLWGSKRDDAWAVGDAGTMLHGDGILWTAVPAVTDRSLRGIWGSGAANVWAVGDYGTVLHFDGTNWTVSPVPTQDWLTGIWGSGPQDVWAVGDGGTILHFDGSRWTAVPSGTTQSLRGVWGSGPADVWAVGDAGTIVRWGGVTWTQIGAGMTTNILYGVWGTGASNIWMVGDSGLILRWSGGLPLVPTQLGGIGGLHAVWGTSPAQAWVVGDRGVLFLWNGSLWTQVESPPSAKLLTAIWGYGQQDVWTVGQGLSLFRHRP